MTYSFHTPGEETWPKRLHVCCGGIYLRGYLNLDLRGRLLEPGEPEPAHATTAYDYYAGLDGDMAHVPTAREPVVDAYADMRHLDVVCGPEQASKILAVQCLEHLDRNGAAAALLEWFCTLRSGGVCIVSVPDVDSTLELLAFPATHDFAIRHLAGTHRDAKFWHRSFWTHGSLQNAMIRAGFSTRTLENPHFYPAVVMEGRK